MSSRSRSCSHFDNPRRQWRLPDSLRTQRLTKSGLISLEYVLTQRRLGELCCDLPRANWNHKFAGRRSASQHDARDRAGKLTLEDPRSLRDFADDHKAPALANKPSSSAKDANDDIWIRHLAVKVYGGIKLQSSRRQIRVVHIHPGRYEDPISCYLTIATLDQNNHTQYDALSYTWGRSLHGSSITLNGVVGFKVTDNLFLALKRLRVVDQVRTAWIDAICINQQDIAERAHQVAFMGDIYHLAQQVIVWLGEPDENNVLLRLANDHIVAHGANPRGHEYDEFFETSNPRNQPYATWLSQWNISGSSYRQFFAQDLQFNSVKKRLDALKVQLDRYEERLPRLSKAFSKDIMSRECFLPRKQLLVLHALEYLVEAILYASGDWWTRAWVRQEYMLSSSPPYFYIGDRRLEYDIFAALIRYMPTGFLLGPGSEIIELRNFMLRWHNLKEGGISFRLQPDLELHDIWREPKPIEHQPAEIHYQSQPSQLRPDSKKIEERLRPRLKDIFNRRSKATKSTYTSEPQRAAEKDSHNQEISQSTTTTEPRPSLLSLRRLQGVATNKRDLVYSLLSLSSPQESALIKVDYRSSEEAVYADTTYALCCAHQSLSPLFDAHEGYAGISGLPELPSWAIDFSIPVMNTTKHELKPKEFLDLPKMHWFRKNGMPSKAFIRKLSWQKIVISGLEFDRVVGTASPGEHLELLPSGDADMVTLLATLFERPPPKYFHDHSISRETPVESLQGHVIPRLQRSEREWKYLKDAMRDSDMEDLTKREWIECTFMSWLRDCRLDEGNEVLSNSSCFAILLAYTESCSSDTKFLLTERGYLGISRETDKDDIVVLAANTPAPILLKPVPDTEDHFEFRGFAYINGIMNGELDAKFDVNNMEQRNYIIV